MVHVHKAVIDARTHITIVLIDDTRTIDAIELLTGRTIDDSRSRTRPSHAEPDVIAVRLDVNTVGDGAGCKLMGGEDAEREWRVVVACWDNWRLWEEEEEDRREGDTSHSTKYTPPRRESLSVSLRYGRTHGSRT